MFKLHSVAGRIFVGVVSGLIIGLLVISFLPTVNIGTFSMFGLGTLMVFVLMGILTGFIGIFDRHPLFRFKMNWFTRGVFVGFVFMLMYILLSYETLNVIMQSSLVSWMGLTSPFWAILDGIFFGIIMSWIETRFAGEGEKLPRT